VYQSTVNQIGDFLEYRYKNCKDVEDLRKNIVFMLDAMNARFTAIQQQNKKG
jgi:hypothetical protein